MTGWTRLGIIRAAVPTYNEAVVMDSLVSRRVFLRAVPLSLIAWLSSGRASWGHPRQTEHPDPRPGIDASDVLTVEQLAGSDKDVIAIFDMVREIPQIVDGIHCYCGCATQPEFRSLLICYTGVGMARACHICQGEGKLVYRRWKEGQTLDQIRRAIDARYA